MLDFKPPIQHTITYRFVMLSLPWTRRVRTKGLKVHVSEESSRRLHDAYQHHCVLLPNHCSHDDAYAMFALSARTHRPFYYLAARENFTEDVGGKWRGLVMQHLGCYSVVRGASDRASFRRTRQLIASGKRPIVMFPEGELSHRTDTVMPFQKGIFTLAFWGMQDLVSTDKDASVLLVPIGIHYTVDKEYEADLQAGFARLERTLLGQEGNADPMERIYRIGSHLLDVLEDVYYGKSRSEMSLTERLAELRSHILGEIERFFQLDPGDDDTFLDRARAVRNRLDEEIYSEVDPESPYAQMVHGRRVERLRGFYDAVKRVCAFYAVDLLAVEQQPRLEALFATLWLIESEVYGAPRSLIPRTAEIRVGDPIVLNEHHSLYQTDKRAAVDEVTTLAENAVKGLVSDTDARD